MATYIYYRRSVIQRIRWFIAFSYEDGNDLFVVYHTLLKFKNRQRHNFVSNTVNNSIHTLIDIFANTFNAAIIGNPDENYPAGPVSECRHRLQEFVFFVWNSRTENAMKVELAIKDVRTRSLDYEQATKHGLSPLQEFFQFWKHPRTLFDPGRLHDCYFYDVYITYFVANWPSQPSPPHPGMFQDFFPTILGRLVGDANTLTLFVKSTDPEYFNELDVIKQLLAPQNLSYVLLPNPIRSEDRRTQVDVGHLIFEWPVASLNYVVKEWFMSPQVTIEGYIGQQAPLAQIASLYFELDTEKRIRELLSTIEIGFRVWPDNNGIFILTDKLDVDALKERLRLPDLNQLLEEASRQHDG